MEKLRAFIIVVMASASAFVSASEAPTFVDDLRIGLMASNAKIELDAGGVASSQDVHATVLFIEKEITPRVSIHADYKHINNGCDSVCDDSTKLTQSFELSARYAQKPMEWLEVFERGGANYYTEKTYSSWHLAHGSKAKSGVSPSLAAGIAISPLEKIQVGLEYDVAFLQSSERAAFTSLFISMTY
jgi:hypothetical protein